MRTKRAFPYASFTGQNHNLVLDGGQLQLDLLYGYKIKEEEEGTG